MDSVTGKILGATTQASYFFDSLRLHFTPIMILDILICTTIFYWVYVFLKETRAMRILYGLFFLLILMALGSVLNLVLLNYILKSIMAMLVVAIPVVFQPELRTALEKLGRTKFLGDMAFTKNDNHKVINEVVAAMLMFSEQKIGALIVIKRQTGLKEYIENGIEIDAVVSAEILSSIFFPKSPLHDGAVIIDGNQIISAGSILPVSQTTFNSKFGTRHKAAVGITENSDAIALVASEETGNISFAVGGKIETRLSVERLRNRLFSSMRQSKN